LGSSVNGAGLSPRGASNIIKEKGFEIF